jgi:hypothetical protein
MGMDLSSGLERGKIVIRLRQNTQRFAVGMNGEVKYFEL